MAKTKQERRDAANWAVVDWVALRRVTWLCAGALLFVLSAYGGR